MNSRAYAMRDKTYLNIALDLSQAPALVAVPWEAMYFDVDGGRFLATDVATNLVRVLPLTFTMPLPPPVEGPLRLLSVISNPFVDLDVEKERSKIQATLEPIQVTPPGGEPRAAFTLLPAVTGATRAKLRNAIRDHKPHILHYSGHGVSGAIALEKDSKPGEADLIDTDALGQIVQNDPPWLTFLNSCEGAQATPSLFGGTAQGLLANSVPFVVAMQGEKGAPPPASEAAAAPSGPPKKWFVLGALGLLLVVAAGLVALMGGLTEMTGTSQACPHVASLAALWWQKLGAAASPERVRQELLFSATKHNLPADFDEIEYGRGRAMAPTS